MMTAKLRKGKNRARYFEFLIDSGADYTLISRYDASLLGIDYAKLNTKEVKVEVANLASIHAKKTQVTLTIGTNDFDIPILVAKEVVERLLGRSGVFSRFEITFKENANFVVFKKI